MSGLALSLGPVIGGVLISGAGWRWIFWFGLGFGAVALAVAAATLTESSDPAGRKLDVPGLATGATAIVAATFGVIEGENRGYGTWWIDVCFAAAAVLVVVFVLIEQRVRDPVFKLEFLRNPTFTAANIVAFATNLSVFSVFFFTALYLQLISNFTRGAGPPASARGCPWCSAVPSRGSGSSSSTGNSPRRRASLRWHGRWRSPGSASGSPS